MKKIIISLVIMLTFLTSNPVQANESFELTIEEAVSFISRTQTGRLIVVFDSTCIPCQKEVSYVVNLIRQYGYPAVFFSVDEDNSTLEYFLEKTSIHFPSPVFRISNEKRKKISLRFNSINVDYSDDDLLFTLVDRQNRVHFSKTVTGVYVSDYLSSLRFDWGEAFGVFLKKHADKFYLVEEGKEKDVENAVVFYEMAADQGNLEAMESLGHIYSDEKNEQFFDRERAFLWYSIATLKGSKKVKSDRSRVGLALKKKR